MSSRYIASGADIATVRAIIQQLPENAGICFREDTQSVVLIDPATGDEITLGTFSGDPGDITVAQDKIIVGQVGDVGLAVDMSGDATIDATGAVTLAQAFQDAADIIAALPTVDPGVDFAVWNNAGVISVSNGN